MHLCFSSIPIQVPFVDHFRKIFGGLCCDSVGKLSRDFRSVADRLTSYYSYSWWARRIRFHWIFWGVTSVKNKKFLGKFFMGLRRKPLNPPQKKIGDDICSDRSETIMRSAIDLFSRKNSFTRCFCLRPITQWTMLESQTMYRR